MIDYAYDLHPRDDPRDGAAIIRYTAADLIAAEFRDAIGVGSGTAIIWHDHDGAENIDSRGEQYVRVVRLGGTEKVVGGFWTSKLPFETAVASERRHLTFSGPGVMAYLARARMAPHTYIHGVFTGQDPFDGMWRLSAQSTIFANGPYLGAMLWRVIYEAQHFRSGSSTYTHRHADGAEYTDNHDDDRTVSRIPDLVLGFDQFEDSNGNAWTLTAGEFSAQVGENVLGVVQRLMQAGLSVWMDPDTFTLYAWEGRPATKLGRSTDRTGAAWGTNVVRFQSPTDGTVPTGNILSDANRVVNAYLPQGPIWVGGNDVYHKETGPSDALYEGFVSSTAEDLTALAQIGAAQSTAREEAADVGDLHHRLGDSPSTGAYLPGEHYRLDELVRVNTGSGEFDYDEANYPVAAWRVSLAAGAAQWEAFAELGASFQEGRERQFTIPSNPGHTHPPNPPLCPPELACELLQASDLTAADADNGDAETDTGEWSGTGGSYQTGRVHGGSRSFGSSATTDGDWTYTFDPSQLFTKGTRYVIEVWKHGNTPLTRELRFGVAGVDEEIGEAHVMEEVSIGGNGWARIRICWTPTEDRTGVRLRFHDTQASEWHVLDDLALYTTEADELNGISKYAARCDHRHRAMDIVLRPPPGTTYRNVQVAIDAVFSQLSATAAGVGWFNVTHPTYGAVGDGVTDDTAAIQSCVDAAAAHGRGSRVYFPRPEAFYLITDTLTASVNLYYCGDGNGDTAGGSEIRMDSANTTAFSLSDGADRSVFECLYIQGPGGNSSGAGIDSTKAVNTERCRIEGFYNGLVEGSGAFYPKHILSSFMFNDNIGLLADAGCNNLDLYGCKLNNNGVGLWAEGCEKITAIGGSIENNSVQGVRIDSTATFTTEAVTIQGVNFENPSATDIRIGQSSAATVKAVSILGCWFHEDATWHIDGQYVDGLIIEGNSLAAGAGLRSKIRVHSPGVNVTVGYNVGSGAYGTLPTSTIFLDPNGLDARYIGGVEITGTPTAGQVPIASDGDSAAWGTVDTDVSEAEVRDAGRWEVVVSGTAPPVALTNEAEDDWLYAWVSGA